MCHVCSTTSDQRTLAETSDLSAALYSVPTSITLLAGLHKASAGRPPPCTHLRRAIRRNHFASKLTQSERPRQQVEKAANDVGCANRLPIEKTELIMTRCWYINVESGSRLAKGTPKRQKSRTIPPCHSPVGMTARRPESKPRSKPDAADL